MQRDRGKGTYENSLQKNILHSCVEMDNSEWGHEILPIMGPIISLGWLLLIAFILRFCGMAPPPPPWPPQPAPIAAPPGPPWPRSQPGPPPWQPGAPGGGGPCPGSRTGLVGSTGSTRRLFFGNFARACKTPLHLIRIPNRGNDLSRDEHLSEVWCT